MNLRARQNAVHAGTAALLLLAFGWGYGGFAVLFEAGAFYKSTVEVFNGMLRYGGLFMAGVAVVCALGRRVGLLLDAVGSGLCGLVMVGCAVAWMVTGQGVDAADVIILVFGAVFLGSARGAWRAYGEVEAPTAVTPPAPRTVHPAEVRPASLPGAGEPPPPEGYLAALSKEKEEPPTASFE